MANKQTRRLNKLGMKTRNMGASTQETKIEHGPKAFMKPDKAKAALIESGTRSWRKTGLHPDDIEIGKR